RLKRFQGYWSRPYDDEIPLRLLHNSPDGEWAPEHDEGDADDELLSQELLPASSFVDRVLFPDGDLAYTNVESAVSKILNKRKQTDGEPEYLVLHADGNEYWTPRSRLVEYTSFITEYENSERVNKGLPPLRRSPRLAELDTEPTEVFQF
ncbi:hypothetical protein DYB28_008870, partial [Aphanomyces astaci]